MDKSFDVYHGRAMSAQTQERTRRRVDWLCAQAYGRVLDIGCSQGIIPYLLAQKKLAVLGIDIDEAAIAEAKANIQTLSEDLQVLASVQVQNLLSFSPDQPFDTIIAGEFLEHLSDGDLIRCIGKIRSLLSANGIFVCTVPVGLHPHPDHHQTFYPRTLCAHLRKYFSIDKIDVESGFIFCICSVASSPSVPSDYELVLLREKALEQSRVLPQKASPERKEQNVQRSSATDNIGQYLEGSQTDISTASATSLGSWLAQKGHTPPYTYNVDLFAALNAYYESRRVVKQGRDLSRNGLFAQADTRVAYLQQIWPGMHGAHCLEVGAAEEKPRYGLRRLRNALSRG